MINIRVYQDVMTPNGIGVMQGIIDDDGVSFVLVSHLICAMDGNTAGKCITPKAKVSGLWEYEPDQVRTM